MLPRGLFLSQRHYILDLLARTMMAITKLVVTPLATTSTLTLHARTELFDPIGFRAIVGSLQYLSLARSNIAYTVSKLSQFMYCPTSYRWIAMKYLRRYLCGTSNHGLIFHHNSSLTLYAFSDSN